MQTFLNCICSPTLKKAKSFNSHSTYFSSITTRLNDNEIAMLEIIYDDLASRHPIKLLTMENFLLFFNLPGLWGAKLFREFDKDGKDVITGEEFIFGMSVTARAPFNDKIQLLYNFFKGNSQDGITYKEFIKMLYNFSKDELKSIFIEDGVFIEQFVINGDTLSNISEKCMSNNRLNKTNIINPNKPLKSVVILDYKCPPTANSNLSQFQSAYHEMINEYQDPGTCLEVKANDKTYHVKYCNMITLVRQFASHVYRKYELSQKTGKLSFLQFKEWIKLHDGLFSHYFKAFHTDLWGFVGKAPSFIHENAVQKSFQGKIFHKGQIKNAYFMLVADSLIVCDAKKSQKEPMKIICLVGLNVNKKNDKNGLGMQISHTSDTYYNTTVYFPSQSTQIQWLKRLKIYDGESLQNKYTVLEMVGTGKFSIVYKCLSKETGKYYALKVIETSKLKEQTKAAISNQSHIMKVAKHPQVIQYYQTLTTRTNINLILEYVEGGDLFDFVSKNGSIDQHETAFVIGQIIKAVIHLHSLDIVHRDLKPENIMITFKSDQNSPSKINRVEKEKEYNQGKMETKSCGKISECSKKYLADQSDCYKEIENVKIIDFGLANHISQLLKLPKQKLMCGTPNYIAPETLLGEIPSFKMDNFAIGSIMYFMLRGRLAFASHTHEEMLIKTVRGDYNLDDSKWDLISNEAKDLVTRLLQHHPEHRIELEEALNHPWFRKVSKQGINMDSIKLMDLDMDHDLNNNQHQSNGSLIHTQGGTKKDSKLGALFRKRRSSIDPILRKDEPEKLCSDRDKRVSNNTYQ